MRMIPWTARAVSVARKATGFALVLAAMAGTAQAGACPPAVPEIDPGSMLSALTLLSGGLMMLTDRRTRSS